MMESELFEDWVLRYGHMLKKRYSKNQKKRFLNSLAADLSALGHEVSLRKDKADKDSLHVVVGDLKKAHTVVATYYDTSAVSTEDYFYFDLEKQKKAITIPILALGGLLLVAGLLVTYFFTIPFLAQGLTWRLVLIALGYFVYFLIFGRITKGWPSGKTMIRNTSSLLLVLDYLKDVPDSSLAFVFYDNGVQGKNSVQKVANKLDLERQQLILLDSIGAEGQLLCLTNNRQKLAIPGIVSQQASELGPKTKLFLVAINRDNEAKKLFLSKEALAAKGLKEENFLLLKEYLANLERGKNK